MRPQTNERARSTQGAVAHAVLAALFTLAVGLAVSRIAQGQLRARARISLRSPCARFLAPDVAGSFLSEDDVRPPVAPMDGDDLLTLVNRSPRWTLAPTFVPSDLVDVRTLQPTASSLCRPPEHQCLRREAANALRGMMAAMRLERQEPYIDSAYRGYDVQCSVFQMWAYRDRHGFCNATVFSALPGHSQHQLGTAVDLFTRGWVFGGERFREGFGCSPGGRWIALHAWEHGFVLPYPLHPDYRQAASECAPRAEALGRVDPRTGYKYEPWHLRYIGAANAARFHAAWLASGPGTAGEITLEQWLRERLGAVDAVEPAVCDGCACGSCATFHDPAVTTSRGPCRAPALLLTRAGTLVPASAPPTLRDVTIDRVDDTTLRVRATVEVPPYTLTQPPIVNPASDLDFDETQTASHFVAVAGGVVHAYPALPGAWRLAISPVGTATPAWLAAIVHDGHDTLGNGINARFAASTGLVAVEVRVHGVRAGQALEVALTENGTSRGLRTVPVP